MAFGAGDDFLAGAASLVSCLIRDVPLCFSRRPGEWSCFREPLPCPGLWSSTRRSRLSSQTSSLSSTPSGSATAMRSRYFSGMLGKWQRDSSDSILVYCFIFLNCSSVFFSPSFPSMILCALFEKVSLQSSILKALNLRNGRCCK